MCLARTGFPLIFVLLGLISSAYGADESKTGKGANLILALIQSWQWATFGVLIVAEFFMLLVLNAAFQSLGKYLKSKRTRSSETDNWNVSGAFCCFTILGTFFLVGYYPLFLVQELMPALLGLDTITHSIIPSGMVVMTIDLADTTIAAAYLACLRRRQFIHFPESLTVWKALLDVATILSMIAITSAKTTLICLVSTYNSDSKIKILNDLFHAFTALYLFVTINIIISAFVLRRAIIRREIQDEVILTNVCLRVCPLIGTQAMFRLAYEIIVSLPPHKAQHIKYGALNFVDIVIKFLVYLFVILYGLRVFWPGKALITFHGLKRQ